LNWPIFTAAAELFRSLRLRTSVTVSAKTVGYDRQGVKLLSRPTMQAVMRGENGSKRIARKHHLRKWIGGGGGMYGTRICGICGICGGGMLIFGMVKFVVGVNLLQSCVGKLVNDPWILGTAKFCGRAVYGLVSNRRDSDFWLSRIQRPPAQIRNPPKNKPRHNSTFLQVRS
jgi:hypothetical protein